MTYLIAVFRARSVTLKAFNYFSDAGVHCSLVSTPQSASVGCGLSLRFDESSLSFVSQELQRAETFVGIFRVTSLNGKTLVTRLT